MYQQHETAKNGRAGRFRGADSLTSLAGFLLIALFAGASLYQLAPPRAARADAPPSQFSSARAAKHLEALARAPHPSGSAEHQGVRAYILQEVRGLGLAHGQTVSAFSPTPTVVVGVRGSVELLIRR